MEEAPSPSPLLQLHDDDIADADAKSSGGAGVGTAAKPQRDDVAEEATLENIGSFHTLLQKGHKKHSVSVLEEEEEKLGGGEGDIMHRIHLDPPLLDFGQRYLCIPHELSLTITNYDRTEELRLYSFETDSLHFHRDTEKLISVPPDNGNVTIYITFLPRHTGFIEATFLLESNFGRFRYHVRGYSDENQYRVQPILGHEIGIRTEFRRSIQIHNSHPTETLRVKEVSTSEKFLLLSIPDYHHLLDERDETNVVGGEGQVKTRQRGAVASTKMQELWEIPPLQSNTIINLNFHANQHGRYQGFVHITTDRDTLTVHVELIVLKGGLPRIVENLDFGEIRVTPSKTSARGIGLLNSGLRPIKVVDVRVKELNQQQDRLQFEYDKGMILQPGAVASVAKLIFLGGQQGHFSGKISIITNDTISEDFVESDSSTIDESWLTGEDSQYLKQQQPGAISIEIRYCAKMIQAIHSHYVGKEYFYSNIREFEKRSISFINPFSTPIQIRSTHISDANFRVVDFNVDLVIQPGEKHQILSLIFQPNTTSLMFETDLVIETNSTGLRIALVCYHGLLTPTVLHYERADLYGLISADSQWITSDQKRCGGNYIPGLQRHHRDTRVDLGLVEAGSSHSLTFVLENTNPISITVMKWEIHFNPDGVTSEADALRSVGVAIIRLCSQSPTTGETLNMNDMNNLPIELYPGNRLLLRMTVTAITHPQMGNGNIVFVTTHQVLRIPFSYSVMDGSLTITQGVDFGESFPGQIRKLPLFARNTHPQPIKLVRVETTDPRFVAHISELVVEPGTEEVQIGFVEMDTSKVQSDANYMQIESSEALTRSTTCIGALCRRRKYRKTVTEAEIEEHRSRSRMFKDLQFRGKTNLRGLINIYTDALRRHSITCNSTSIIPRLATHDTMHFGMTHVGKANSHLVRIHNPSDKQVLVQIFVGNATLANTLNTSIDEDNDDMLVTNVEANEAAQLKLSSVARSIRAIMDEHDTEYVPFAIDKAYQGVSALIPPRKLGSIGPIVFSPTIPGISEAYLYLRNNLTTFEIIKLHGIAGHASMHFIDPNNDQERLSVLAFNITESDLGRWDDENENFLISSEFAVATEFNSVSNKETAMKDTMADREYDFAFTRAFTITNDGNLPIRVEGMSVGPFGCEVYGFKLLSCEPFDIAPGRTHDILLRYRPDFSTSLLDLSLQLYTSDGDKFEYPLTITLPFKLLPHLYGVQQMSMSEKLSRSLATSIVILLAVFLIIRIRNKISKQHRQQTQYHEQQPRRLSMISIGIAQPSLADIITGDEHTDADIELKHVEKDDGEAVPSSDRNSRQSPSKKSRKQAKASNPVKDKEWANVRDEQLPTSLASKATSQDADISSGMRDDHDTAAENERMKIPLTKDETKDSVDNGADDMNELQSISSDEAPLELDDDELLRSGFAEVLTRKNEQAQLEFERQRQRSKRQREIQKAIQAKAAATTLTSSPTSNHRQPKSSPSQPTRKVSSASTKSDNSPSSVPVSKATGKYGNPRQNQSQQAYVRQNQYSSTGRKQVGKDVTYPSVLKSSSTFSKRDNTRERASSDPAKRGHSARLRPSIRVPKQHRVPYASAVTSGSAPLSTTSSNVSLNQQRKRNESNVPADPRSKTAQKTSEAISNATATAFRSKEEQAAAVDKKWKKKKYQEESSNGSSKNNNPTEKMVLGSEGKGPVAGDSVKVDSISLWQSPNMDMPTAHVARHRNLKNQKDAYVDSMTVVGASDSYLNSILPQPRGNTIDRGYVGTQGNHDSSSFWYNASSLEDSRPRSTSPNIQFESMSSLRDPLFNPPSTSDPHYSPISSISSRPQHLRRPDETVVDRLASLLKRAPSSMANEERNSDGYFSLFERNEMVPDRSRAASTSSGGYRQFDFVDTSPGDFRPPSSVEHSPIEDKKVLKQQQQGYPAAATTSVIDGMNEGTGRSPRQRLERRAPPVALNIAKPHAHSLQSTSLFSSSPSRFAMPRMEGLGRFDHHPPNAESHLPYGQQQQQQQQSHSESAPSSTHSQ